MSLEDLFNSLEANTNDDLSRDVRIIRAPFPWPGSKARSIERILPLLPYRSRWIDVFGGSGIVTWARQPSKFEVYNDRYSGLTCFYRCLANKKMMDALCERIDLTIHSREEFVFCKETWFDCEDVVERAARWFYMVSYSFGALGRNWARATTSGSLSGKIRNRIPEFPALHERIKNVQIENLDFESCLVDYDSEDTVFYLDPDWPDASRGIYKHQMTIEDHQRMVNRIFSMKGFVALSGYDNPIYNNYDWDAKHEFEVFVSIKSIGAKGNGKDHIMDVTREKKTECLWIKE